MRTAAPGERRIAAYARDGYAEVRGALAAGEKALARALLAFLSTRLTVLACAKCGAAAVNDSGRCRAHATGLARRSAARRPSQPWRTRTISRKRLAAELRHSGDFEEPEIVQLRAHRPVTRGDCAGGERPCPWVSCKFNLWLDVTEAGSIKLNFPGREVDGIEHTCALDVADAGGVTLKRVGVLMSLTRERVRQIEAAALSKLNRAVEQVAA